MGQLTYVGGLLRAVLGNLIEEFLDLGEILELYLFDKKYIHLGHHVHGLQEVLAVVTMFLEERIETVMDIVLEILVGRDLRKDLFDDMLMGFEYLLKAVRLEVIACKEVDELTERETAQVIALHDTIELWVLVLKSHHT